MKILHCIVSISHSIWLLRKIFQFSESHIDFSRQRKSAEQRVIRFGACVSSHYTAAGIDYGAHTYMYDYVLVCARMCCWVNDSVQFSRALKWWFALLRFSPIITHLRRSENILVGCPALAYNQIERSLLEMKWNKILESFLLLIKNVHIQMLGQRKKSMKCPMAIII